jgi:probable F420-dependent oxidoreductase
MRIGLVPAAGNGVRSDPAYVTDYLQTAEGSGFDSVWVGEHPALPVTSTTAYPGRSEGLSEPSAVPLPDPLEWLAFAAGRCERILLGTAIIILPIHNPVVLAKRIATLDRVSSERLLLGVGVGWNEQEFAACGADWSSRGPRTDEAIAAMRELWREETAGFEGLTFSFEPLFSSPRPARGVVPIHVGASSTAGARRAGRLGDGYLPFERDLEELARRISEMKSAAEQAGRDPESIQITTLGSTRPERVRELVRLGVHRMLFFADDVDELGDLSRRAHDAIAGTEESRES